MQQLMSLALNERIIVIGTALVLLVVGIFAFTQLDIEAYPDPVQPMIEVLTLPNGLSAEEVERLVTVPLEFGLSGMLGLEAMRSISIYGLSDIRCYFDWVEVMERVDEEAKREESACGGAAQVRRTRPQRSQTARQQGERSQGRPGQKPQENCSSAPQCAAATPWASQEAVNLLIQFICARYGQLAIGRGDGSIRYRAASHCA
jgi:hypothetical protein